MLWINKCKSCPTFGYDLNNNGFKPVIKHATLPSVGVSMKGTEPFLSQENRERKGGGKKGCYLLVKNLEQLT